MEIVCKLLLGVCLLSSIQFFYIDAGGSKHRDTELAKDEFEIIIHDEQFMHYFVNMGLKISGKMHKMRKKIKNIFARGIPHEFYISEFPQKKYELEAILYHPEFGITRLSDPNFENKALRNRDLFNQQLNDKTVNIYEFTHKEIKKNKPRVSYCPDITNYVYAPIKEFESVISHSILYQKIGEAVCSYLDKEITELPHFYVKIKIDTKEKTFTVQAAPNHDQSAFIRTYDSIRMLIWFNDRSCLTNYCLEFLL